MTYSHLLLGAAMCVVTSSAIGATEQPSTHSAYGFGGGLIAGAAFGGPIGAIVGATIGVLMVEEHNDDAHIASLQQDLVVARNSLSSQDDEIARLAILQSIQPVTYTTTIAPDFPEMKSHIQFTSGMTDIAPSYYEQLDLLASILKDNHKLQINLTGFADLRGTSEDNLLLSAARTDAVKTYLLKAQVPALQIVTSALGESTAQQATTWDESLFFDRRVTLHITPISTMTAAN